MTELHENATPLDEVLVLTGAMLDGARARDWAAVANLETARAALLRAVFEGAARPPAEQLARVAQQVLDADRELIALGEQARGAVAAELAQLRQAQRVHHAYTEGAGD